MKSLLSLLAVIIIFHCPVYAQLDFTHTKGPEGVTGYHLFQNDNFLFIHDLSFVYRSEDGENWTKIDRDLGDFSIHGSTIASLYRDAPKNYFLDITFDNGDNWELKPIPEQDYFSDIAINSDVIFLVSGSLEKKLWKSINHGNSWTIEEPPLISVSDLYSFDNKIYAQNSKYLVSYNNESQEWEDSGLPPLNDHESIVDVYATENKIIVGTNQSTYTSNDNGSTWDKNELIYVDFNDSLFGSEDTTVVVNGNFASYSDNFGAQWSQNLQLSHDVLVYDGAFFKSDLYLSDHHSGLLKGDFESNSVSKHNNGLSSARVHSTSLQKDSILWTMTRNAVFKYNLKHKSWSRETFFPDFNGYDFINSSDNGMVVCDSWIGHNDYYFLSEDFGQTWAQKQSPPQFESFGIAKVFVSGSTLYCQNTFDKIVISDDKGSNWRIFPEFNLSEQEELIRFKNKNWLFGRQGLHSSGDHFLTYNTTEFDFRIEQVYSTKNYLFILGTNTDWERVLYYSTNGSSWIKSQWDFNQFFDQTSLAFVPASYDFFEHQDTLYFNGGHVINLYYSVDGGVTWECHSDGFSGGINVTAYTDDTIYAGAAGIFSSPYPTPHVKTITADFELPIYFEDALGNKDKIVIGYDDQGTTDIQTEFAENEIIDTELGSEFEVRVGSYNYSDIDCNNLMDPRISESKKWIRENATWAENNATMITIKSKNLPFTVEWDPTTVNISSADLKIMDWMPDNWGEESCSDNAKEYSMSQNYRLQFDKTDYQIYKEGDTLFTLFLSYTPETVSTVNQQQHIDLARIYPNPASTSLSIEAIATNEDLFSKNSVFKMYDTLGNLVLWQDVKPEILLDKLVDGLYFYQIELANNKVQKGKVMVIK